MTRQDSSIGLALVWDTKGFECDTHCMLLIQFKSIQFYFNHNIQIHINTTTAIVFLKISIYKMYIMVEEMHQKARRINKQRTTFTTKKHIYLK